MFIMQAPRKAWKPECISAQMLRARARAALSAGHNAVLRELLGHIFRDRQGVPDDQITVDQHRHLARRD
jgi:hypothetical protein